MEGSFTNYNVRQTIGRIMEQRERSLGYLVGILGAAEEERERLHEQAAARLKEQLADARNSLARFEGLQPYRSWDGHQRDPYTRRISEIERELAREERDAWRDSLDLSRTLLSYNARLEKERALRTLGYA